MKKTSFLFQDKNTHYKGYNRCGSFKSVILNLLFFIILFIANSQAQGILHTSGNKIVDSSGKQVILRGVNLGGWLVTEDWMCGISDSTDPGGRSARQTLESLYPESQVIQLLNIWEDNWITAADIDTIKSLGFNLLRVPFGWRNLQYQNQQWYLDSSGNIDFTRFDWIVNQAAVHNMYVIFDFHVWLNQNINYSGISNVDSVILSTCTIWREVANHFKNNPTVAAYDLLNEPTSSTDDTVMQMIYDTVRSIDPNHIISLEGVSFDTARWHNVLYQSHWYGLTSATLPQNIAYFDSAYLPILFEADSLRVPYYVGETQVPNDSSMAWSLNQYCLYQTNWSPWTYKTINQWGWGLLSLYPSNVSVNIVTDPFNTILSKWSQISNANNCYELQDVKTIWSNAAQSDCLVSNIPSINGQNLTINLYPNPAKNYVFVQTDKAAIGGTIQITDIAGREITKSDIRNQESKISTSAFSSGVYFVKISSPNGQSIVSKLVVMGL